VISKTRPFSPARKIGSVSGVGSPFLSVKDPTKNIPRALIIGFIIVVVIYVSVPLAVTRLLSWNTLGETQAAVAVASEVFLPAWLAKIIALSVLMAIATCINGVFMANTRDFLAYGRNGIYPAFFPELEKKTGHLM